MKLVAASAAGILVAAGAFGAVSYPVTAPRWFADWQNVSTDNAYIRSDVTPISPKIAGYVIEVGVSDNQRVTAGQVLFRIDDADYRARVAQSDAALKARKAAIGNLESQLALQETAIRQAEAALQGARADADRSRRDRVRTSQLSRRGLASTANNDLAQSDSLRADAKVAEAEANHAAALQSLNVLESQRPQLLADIDAAAAALELARIDLQNTVIRAPSGGRVGERQARVGQYVRPGTQIVALVSHDVWVVANFKETQLPGVVPGRAVSILVDGAPGIDFTGRVESLSPASGAQFALLPPDNATGNFTRIVQRIPVRITLDTAQGGLDSLRPGMSASVDVFNGEP